MGRLIPVMEYRDPEGVWDENGSGEMETHPETFVICVGCGVAVYDVEAHEEHHALLRRLKQLL
jgi:hypothetical protein